MEIDRLHQHVFDAVPDPLVVLDARGLLLAANAAALRLLDIGDARPGVRVGVDMKSLADLAARGQEMEGFRVTDRQGRDTGITVDAIPRVANGTLLHFRVRAEGLSRELWTDDAVSTVAHEFRNPLTSMRSALNLLAAGDAGELTPPQSRFIEAVQRGVARLTGIVDGYLDLGRARAGVLSLDRRERDAHELLDGVVHDFSLCQSATGARITVDVPDGSPRVFVDADRITQVLLNLLYNAARFTPDDGQVTLRAGYAGREALDDDLRVLPFEILGQPVFTCLEVEDEGIGMGADVLAHVFERYREEGHDADQPGGAHLGLHIARTLVSAHDGTLRIDSRLGQGTTARVLLPSNAATAHLMSRLRLAGEAVETARMARRIVTVALIEDETLRMDAGLPAHMWMIRDGLGLVVTCGDLPAVGSRLAGACRVGANMTFSGAVRSAAARLVEQKNRVRALAPVSKEE